MVRSVNSSPLLLCARLLETDNWFLGLADVIISRGGMYRDCGRLYTCSIGIDAKNLGILQNRWTSVSESGTSVSWKLDIESGKRRARTALTC